MTLYRQIRGPATLRFERVLPEEPDRASLAIFNESPFRIVARLVYAARRKKGFHICIEPGAMWTDKGPRCHKGPVSLRSVGGVFRGQGFSMIEYVKGKPRRKP